MEITSAPADSSGGDCMSEKKETLDNLDKTPITEISTFEENLNLSVEELLKKSIKENWQVKHLELWVKLKNARNFERLVTAVEAL